METPAAAPETPVPPVPPPGEAAPPPAPAADPATHFIFKHRIFLIERCRFALNGSDKLACFCVPMGDQVAAIELRKLQEEFTLPPEDEKLLKMVERGLRYVRDIRPNDSIPREILDGSASWSVEEKHKQLAKAKLNMELIYWITGARGEYPSLADMEKLQKDHEGRMHIRDAHVKLTQLLGLKDPQATVERVESLVRETPYIEALHERALGLEEIAQKLSSFATSFKKESAFIAEIMRMQDLVRRATRLISDRFAKADRAVEDLPRALGETPMAIVIIREARDEANGELKKWDKHFEYWAEIKVDRSEKNEKYFRRFYQFLAENYMEQAAWNSLIKK